MPNPRGAARNDDFTALSRELQVPGGFTGFGNYLVWMVGTRAVALVDAVYSSGAARPSPGYRMRDGHHLPTQALVARFIVASRSRVDPATMPRDDGNLHKAQRSLSATMTPAMGAEPQRFREEWLRDIAALCALNEAELRFLLLARRMPGLQLDPAALKRGVAATRAAGLPPGPRHAPVPADPAGAAAPRPAQLVVGTVPREPAGFVARDLVNTPGGGRGEWPGRGDLRGDRNARGRQDAAGGRLRQAADSGRLGPHRLGQRRGQAVAGR